MSRSSQPAGTRRFAQGQRDTALGMANLWFASSAANVPVSILKDSPGLMVAAVEDLCWRLALLDWTEHEPPRYDRARHHAWKDESTRLEDKRNRVRSMVDEALRTS
jgi:hypothetical protein